MLWVCPPKKNVNLIAFTRKTLNISIKFGWVFHPVSPRPWEIPENLLKSDNVSRDLKNRLNICSLTKSISNLLYNYLLNFIPSMKTCANEQNRRKISHNQFGNKVWSAKILTWVMIVWPVRAIHWECMTARTFSSLEPFSWRYVKWILQPHTRTSEIFCG